jgi:hypothetical protein
MDNLNEKKKKRDRCLRIADRKYDKPSAYKSAAAERCRQGDIWKDIKEGSEEEAWEFVLSPDPNIKKVVQQANLSDKEEDIKKITSIIDNTKTRAISSSQIVKLKNFNNKPGEESLINDMISVSKSQNPRQSYTDYMKKRDKTEGRDRGYDPVQNFDNVVKGSYEPPVLINVNGTLYVIGGRTRLYAGLAANKSMNVKIIDISQLKEADDPQAGKSAAAERCRQGDIWKNLKEAFTQVLQEDESLYKWLKRQGPPGKEGGWVDCNTCREVDGKTKCKACGRKKGEKRAKYPSCRPTPEKCKDPGKGKTWGKTKEDMIKLKDLILELDSEKIFHIEGTIIIDNQKRDVQDILSDVRALPGITVVRNVEIPQDATSRYFRSSLEIKVDPYPYIKQNKFDGKATLEAVANNIKIIPGVVGFKQTAEPYSSDN